MTVTLSATIVSTPCQTLLAIAPYPVVWATAAMALVKEAQ